MKTILKTSILATTAAILLIGAVAPALMDDAYATHWAKKFKKDVKKPSGQSQKAKDNKQSIQQQQSNSVSVKGSANQVQTNQQQCAVNNKQINTGNAGSGTGGAGTGGTGNENSGLQAQLGVANTGGPGVGGTGAAGDIDQNPDNIDDSCLSQQNNNTGVQTAVNDEIQDQN